MNSKNKIIFDKTKEIVKNKLEASEGKDTFGHLKVELDYNVVAGNITSDFSVETKFKQTFKLNK